MGFARIAGLDAVVVPAQTYIDLTAHGPTRYGDSTAVLEPLTGASPGGLIMVPSLVQGWRFIARLVNLSNKDVKLQPNTRVEVLRGILDVECGEIGVSIEQDTMVISTDRRGPEPKQRSISTGEINKDDFPGTNAEYDMARDLFTKYKDVFAQSEDDVGHSSSNSLRLCVDYRTLNAKATRVVHPLPRIDESLEALSGTSLYSSIDPNLPITRWECIGKTNTGRPSPPRLDCGSFDGCHLV